MNSFLTYFLMSILIIAIIFATFLLRNQRVVSAKIGFICWISLSIYFIIEYIVISATTAPYNFLKQPMSDLGVTACGKDAYVIASYEICSPYHQLMNWTFIVTGIVIFVGAICLHQFWPDKRQTRIATILLVIFGLSYTISGIVPADVNFLWHTFASLPGMFVQIPALVIIGLSIRRKMPKLSLWTFVCAVISASSLVLLFFQPLLIDLPGGLLQRILYGAVYFWMAITAIVLWQMPSSFTPNKMRHISDSGNRKYI